MKIVSNGIKATVEQYIDLMTGLAKPSPINNGLFSAYIKTEAHVLGDLYRWVGFASPLTVQSGHTKSDPIANVLIHSNLPTRPSVGAPLAGGWESRYCHMKCDGKAVSSSTLARFLQSWRETGDATESLIPVASVEEVLCDYQNAYESAYTDSNGWAIKLQKPLKLMCARRVIRSIDRIFVVTPAVKDGRLLLPKTELGPDILREGLTNNIYYLRGFSPAANLSQDLTDFFGGRKARDELWYGPNYVQMDVEDSFHTEILAALGVGGSAPYKKGRIQRLFDRVDQLGKVQGRTIDDLEASFFQIYRN